MTGPAKWPSDAVQFGGPDWAAIKSARITPERLERVTEAMTTEPITLPTAEFWDRMCSPGFVRLSLHTGAIEGTVYYTENPPEMMPGFLGGVLDAIKSNLGIEP